MAPLLLALWGCSSNGGDDYGLLQPGQIDARISGDAPGGGSSARDASIDARPDAAPGATDAAPDAPVVGADLSIAIGAAPSPVPAGATLTYTIDVTNHGSLDAAGVEVTQRLPSGNVALESTNGIGWSCNGAGQLVTCTRATLLVGAAPSIVVQIATPPTGSSLTTSATVTADTPDTDVSNNDASATTAVLTPADLAIAITGAPDPVAAGGTLSYTILASNLGPGSATALTVRDSLPSGLSFASATGTGWSCSAVSQDVTCLAAGLAAGASSRITLVVTGPGSGGGITNTVSVLAATPDSDLTNNTAAAATTVNAAADLAIAITDSPDPVLGSGVLSYSVDVNNLGPNTASAITVTDLLPAGNVVFSSATGSGWTCQPSGQVVACSRAQLLVGPAPTITINILAPSEAATLIDSATVASTSSDLALGNNTSSVTTSVASAANLSVAVIDSADPVTTGGTLTYTVTAVNAGPSQAAGVSVTSMLPAGSTFAGATGTNWACSALGQQVTCTTPVLVIGAAPPITILATAPPVDGTITETSTIASPTFDPVVGNNTASQTTVVNAPSDLALQLSAQVAAVAARATLTYTIAITNLGPRDATNLVVTNRLPDGDVVFLGAGGIGWTCALAGQIVTCTRPLLIAGVAPSITIQITSPPSSGDLLDVASVAASTMDPDLSDNTASTTTSVFDSADLSITAADGPDPVRIGHDVTYTLSVGNAGPTAATAVTVVDTLPAGSTLVSATGGGWSCSETDEDEVTCTRVGLNAESSAPAIKIVATAPASSGTITNTATVSSPTSDPDLANNTATTQTLDNPFADLSLAISGDVDTVTGSTSTDCSSGCVTYSIDVTNAGPDPASAVKVVTTLPANGSFFQAIGTGWVCPAPSGTLTCTRTSLAVGPAPTITLKWRAPKPGGFSIVVSSVVSASSTDTDASNNAATEDTTVLP